MAKATQTGKTLTVNTWQKAALYELKAKIASVTDIEPRDQRLIFAGRQLEDEFRVCDYNIRDEAAIQLVLRLCGGGETHVDMSNPNGPKVCKVSDTAPLGRTIRPGHHREGSCPNLACATHNRYKVCDVRDAIWDTGTGPLT